LFLAKRLPREQGPFRYSTQVGSGHNKIWACATNLLQLKIIKYLIEQPSFPRMVWPVRIGHYPTSIEEVHVRAGHRVLQEVEVDSVSIVADLSGILGRQLRSQCYKTFYGSNLRILYKARVFVPDKPFQPSLMSAVKAGAYLSEAHFTSSNLG
jgi:hypothetical protein